MPSQSHALPRLLLVFLIAIGIGVPFIVWQRAGNAAAITGRPWDELSKAEQDEFSQKSYQELQETPVSSLGDLEGVRSHMSRIRWGVEGGVRAFNVDRQFEGTSAAAIDRQILIELASELIYYRYMQSDVEAYKRWRRDLGYALKPTDRLLKVWSVAQDYETVFEEQYPGDEHFEQVFDRFWAHGLSGINKANRVLGLCEGPGAAYIAFGKVSQNRPGDWPFPESAGAGRPGPVWVGTSASTHRDWWTAPHGEFADVLRGGQIIRVACLGIVVRYGDGIRLPMLLQFYQYPAGGQWWFRHFVVQNVPLNRNPGPTEF
ncbi:MAG: hypothetical protein KF866_12435 [Phycisphaeraceae bacterium]|nr:hypothetical protein [Phycisphaeraceae bacterium]MCW5754063.1 hypothetical protein [Phycisphaeraceae bacterium]